MASAVLNRCLRASRRAWPESCVLCGASATGASPAYGPEIQRLCSPCAASLPRLHERRCDVCAVPLTSGETCGACLSRPPAYDSVSVGHVYGFPVDALILAYKYGGDLTLAPILAALLEPVRVIPVDVLVAMPLSAARLQERGFNQAHELARNLSRRCRVPVLSNAVRRVADTAPQAVLPWKERAQNVRGAFVCDADLTGLHVAVVDDVMTTGATLNELAMNLKCAGAARVSGCVVARTLREEQIAREVHVYFAPDCNLN